MTVRIVLVHPAGYNWMPGKKDVTATANRMAPLGLLSIAAFLEKRGHDVHIIDCLGPKAITGTEAVAKQILSHAPDFVGFSATTSGFLNAYEIASRIKEPHPQLPVVFGGVHVSALKSILLDQFEKIDFFVHWGGGVDDGGSGRWKAPKRNLRPGVARKRNLGPQSTPGIHCPA